MALSTVDHRSKPVASGATPVVSAATVLIYAVLTLVSHFPAFHDHGPLPCNSCSCVEEKSCDISHNHAGHHSAGEWRSGEHHERGHGPCMACMWQAMVKRQVASHNFLQISTPFLHQKYENPNSVPPCSCFLSLQQSRAPPV